MCGKQTEKLVYSEIEGTELRVCSNCARYGTNTRSIHKPRVPNPKFMSKKKQEEENIIEMIIPDYAQKVKQAREKMGLKQEEFARMLNEKMSLVQNVENGKFKPPLKLARKLERMLNIIITEKIKQDELPDFAQEKSSGDGLTIGDLINIKKK
jgi:putative transcription factor